MRFGKLAYVWFEKGHIKVTNIYWGAHGPPYLPKSMALMGINVFLCVCVYS